jgi:nitroimidazol reductase NimA-like FMN-containing flavoprotein (pyridoxamine 5'-phosphate oxidase superfamily)
MSERPDSFAPTPRTRVRRVPKRAVYERAAVEAILDEALFCHVGFVAGDQPYVIPTLHARVGEQLYLHGSSASRMVRTLAEGAPACVTASLIDGLVLARSAFHHSMNYRAAVVLGGARLVEGDDERMAALEAFTEALVPGRWPHIRWPDRREMKGTAVLAVDLREASAKVRTGDPVDDEADYARPVWAGVVPVALAAGDPVPDARLADGTPLPGHVAGWRPAPGRRPRG